MKTGFSVPCSRTKTGLCVFHIEISAPGSVIKHKVECLFDTGASATFISKRVSQAVGVTIMPTNKITRMGKYTDNPSLTVIDIHFPAGVKVHNQPVYIQEIEQDIVIGMDIISQGNFALTYQKGVYILSFNPSQQQ